MKKLSAKEKRRRWLWAGSTRPIPTKIEFVPRGASAFGRHEELRGVARQFPLEVEAGLENRAKIADRLATLEQRGDFSRLIPMFNRGVEFVRKLANGQYIAAKEGAKRNPPTHRLIATRWNYDDAKANTSRALWTPLRSEYATSVAAEPLRWQNERPEIAVKRVFPRRGNVPVYKRDANLHGKREVLRHIVKKMGAAIAVKAVRKLDDAACDHLYDDLIRASRKLYSQRERERARLHSETSATKEETK